MTTSWYEQNLALLSSLNGCRVQGWSGIEMALIEQGPDGRPVFELTEVPCLQMALLILRLEGTTVGLRTHQDDDLWGLEAYRGDTSIDATGWAGIYRSRTDLDLPLGLLALEVSQAHNGRITRLDLRVDQQPLVVFPAEFEETSHGLELVSDDESVVVFKGVSAIERASWRRPPYNHALQLTKARRR